jgi:hypothetical protein
MFQPGKIRRPAQQPTKGERGQPFRKPSQTENRKPTKIENPQLPP